MEKLTTSEKKFLQSLNTPLKIQDFLDTLPFNSEKNGESCMSPRRVLREQKAHCLEGGMLAAVALSLQKREPCILNLKVKNNDYDHVIALYKENGYWGAISKTNHAVLGFRDPVYKTIRELAMSYFHEYFLVTTGEKTLIGYSRSINLKRFGTSWITEEKDLWDIAETIFDLKHSPTIPKENEKYVRRATSLERESANIQEWK